MWIMRTKQAFTLIELMGVIIVLGFICVIAVPIVNKQIRKSKEDLYEVQLKNIEEAAENWTYQNAELLPNVDGNRVTVTLGQLKQGKFLDLNITDPRTEELLPNDMVVVIEKKGNHYLFYVDRYSGTTEFATTFDENAPTIVLSGDYIQYVEIHSPYVEKGAFAKSTSGSDITSTIRREYYHENTEISEIRTDTFATYTVHYIVTENGVSSKAIRTIIIRDTTAPELTIPGNVTITQDEVANFDVMTGVSAHDNSGLSVDIKVQSQLASVSGKYIITYMAIDKSGNKTVKKRIITVE